MSNNNISYPYPILNLGDDIQGDFINNPKVYVQKDILIIDVIDLNITNSYFNDLISNNEAIIVTKAHCSSTMYSETFINSKVIEISLNKVANAITVSYFIVANKYISKYYDTTFNLDFFENKNNKYFEVTKGSVIGLGGEIRIPLLSIFNEGISGVFEFQFRSEDSPITFDIDGNKIIIYYPKIEGDDDIISLLGRKGGKYLNTFYNLILLPALTHAFNVLIEKNRDGQLDDYIETHIWAMILSDHHPQFTEDENGYISAQILLKKINKQNINRVPIFNAFEELKD